jgi:hypothetical protein
MLELYRVCGSESFYALDRPAEIDFICQNYGPGRHCPISRPYCPIRDLQASYAGWRATPFSIDSARAELHGLSQMR